MHIALIMGRIEEIGEKHLFIDSGDPKKSQNNEKIFENNQRILKIMKNFKDIFHMYQKIIMFV